MEFQDKSRTCINDAWFNRQLYYRLPTFSLSRYYCDLLLELPAIYIPQILTKYRIINKSILLKKKIQQNLSLCIIFLRTNIFTINKFSIGGENKNTEALIVYGIQRNKINPLSPEIAGESEGSGNGDGASITVDGVGESRDNRRYMVKAVVIPRSGMIRGAHRCRAPRNRRAATSRAHVWMTDVWPPLGGRVQTKGSGLR